MKYKLYILIVLLFVILNNCKKTETENISDQNINNTFEIGISRVYKNLIYNGIDTTFKIDTMTIIGKYKDYLIEETKHGNWTGISLVKYNNKYTVYGIINNSDTTIFKNPKVLGYMNGSIGYIDSDSILNVDNMKCAESLYITRISNYNILGVEDTVFSHYFTSTCPSVSHRYDYYSNKYGLVYNKAIERGKDRIVQEIILEKIIKNK